MKKKKTLLLFASITILFATSLRGFAQQQERIIRFHSDIKIETDGRIEVAEHIRLYAGGDDIKRGIVRDIPLYRENSAGERERMNFKVLGVKCNGNDAKYRVENGNSIMSIYIGDADVLLEPGEYDYTIVYETIGQVVFADDLDKLFWNVTNNGWKFAIEQASATITLPGNAKALQTTCLTGMRGASGKDCSVEDRGNIQVFTVNRRLAPGEGLVVGLSFPRDVVDRSQPSDMAEEFLSEPSDFEQEQEQEQDQKEFDDADHASPVSAQQQENDDNIDRTSPPTESAQQRERIIRFHSDIKIETDGRIEVAEHIRVYAGGNKIKRGIIRSIPVYRKNKFGDMVRTGIDVISVTCNGKDAVYDRLSGYDVEIRIGDADVLLNPGEYDYVITYTSRGQIGLFKKFDELYWNVTGTKWDYPIEAASATVTLPDGAAAIKTYAYTGKQGAKGQDYTVEDRGNVQTFTATRKFAPRENITIAVAFPTGIIDRPPPLSTSETLVAFFNSTRGVAVFYFLITALVFVILLLTKRIPKSGVIIPQFAPPNGWSPGVINYVYQGQYVPKGFTAAIIQMAVKGALTISKTGRKHTLFNTSDVSRLNAEELPLHTRLFKDGNKLTVSKKNRHDFQMAQLEHGRAVRNEVNIGNYWFDNFVRVLSGLLAIIIIQCIYWIRLGDDYDFYESLFVSLPFVVLMFATLFRSKRILIKYSIIAVAVGIPLFYLFDAYINPHTLLMTASTILFSVYSAFLTLIPRPQGRKTLDDIKGFRMYMKIAESHRLKLLNAPEQTPEHFEKMLPYAIALGVVGQWSKKFATVLETANYQPTWSNDKFEADSWSSFDRSFVNTFSRSVASSSREKTDWNIFSGSGSSDWSSGSGGGGYSGGGGGGGGGRGW